MVARQLKNGRNDISIDTLRLNVAHHARRISKSVLEATAIIIDLYQSAA
jgi:hypothetical protein